MLQIVKGFTEALCFEMTPFWLFSGLRNVEIELVLNIVFYKSACIDIWLTTASKHQKGTRLKRP